MLSGQVKEVLCPKGPFTSSMPHRREGGGVVLVRLGVYTLPHYHACIWTTPTSGWIFSPMHNELSLFPAVGELIPRAESFDLFQNYFQGFKHLGIRADCSYPEGLLSYLYNRAHEG